MWPSGTHFKPGGEISSSFGLSLNWIGLVSVGGTASKPPLEGGGLVVSFSGCVAVGKGADRRSPIAIPVKAALVRKPRRVEVLTDGRSEGRYDCLLSVTVEIIVYFGAEIKLSRSA
ncbi:hypothetical protein ACFLZP_03295 [Patescibacteria group bacterium]